MAMVIPIAAPQSEQAGQTQKAKQAPLPVVAIVIVSNVRDPVGCRGSDGVLSYGRGRSRKNDGSCKQQNLVANSHVTSC
jgi:hypothetical protein